jgi:hypothetical protein
MWFQRVTEVGEAEEDMPERGVMEGSFNGREQFNKLPPRRSSPLLSPADFQRVRMLRKINRWTAIRIMAAESAARRQKEGRGEDEQKRDQPSPKSDDGESSEEESTSALFQTMTNTDMNSHRIPSCTN